MKKLFSVFGLLALVAGFEASSFAGNTVKTTCGLSGTIDTRIASCAKAYPKFAKNPNWSLVSYFGEKVRVYRDNRTKLFWAEPGKKEITQAQAFEFCPNVLREFGLWDDYPATFQLAEYADLSEGKTNGLLNAFSLQISGILFWTKTQGDSPKDVILWDSFRNKGYSVQAKHRINTFKKHYAFCVGNERK